MYHSWFLISVTVNLLEGSVFKTFLIKSFDGFEINPGMR